jgi:acyl-CoA dehydrogenase
MNPIFERIERRRGWTAEETLLLDQVRRLCAEQIAPCAAHHDRSGEFPWDNIRRINELGLNRIFLPEAHGGVGLRFRAYLEVVKILAEACAATAIIYATNYHALGPLMDFGSEALKARVLPRARSARSPSPRRSAARTPPP